MSLEVWAHEIVTGAGLGKEGETDKEGKVCKKIRELR